VERKLLQFRAMSNRSMVRNTALLLLAANVALGGCIGGTPDAGRTSDALAEGLTVLEAREGALSLAYRRADHVIYLEAVRGHETPEMYREDPGAPLYEIDVRFTSDQGDAFYTRRGGDEWIEPSWVEDLDRQAERGPTGASNRVMFELAGEAAGVLREAIAEQLDADRAAGVEHEMVAILGFAQEAPEQYLENLDRLVEHRASESLPPPVLEDRNGDVAFGSDLGGPDSENVSFGAGYYYIAVHDASTAVIARHSATQLMLWSNSAWLQIHNSCNHGRCANEMGRKCLLQYYEAVADHQPSLTLTQCRTGYDAFSNDGHNCHDDTRNQMHNFVYASLNNGYERWCNDGDSSADFSSWPGDQSGSPECNSRRDPGYNHPNRCQYNFTSSCPSSYQGTSDGCDCGCVFPDGTGSDPDCR
jgi:hypothetical protein